MIKERNTKKTIKKEEAEISQQFMLAKKTNVLNLSSYNLNIWPKPIFDLTMIKIIDLSYNNIEYIPKEIGTFKELKELYLNDNPLQGVPIEISECTKLKVIDLSNTVVKWLPRDMAKLLLLNILKLENCPLQGKLATVYTQGINAMMEYFQRKYDRSKYRALLIKYLKEWVYVQNSYDEIQKMMEIIFKNTKDLETKHFKRMLKNAQYLFPKKIELVNPIEIKENLLESFRKDLAQTSTLNSSMKGTKKSV